MILLIHTRAAIQQIHRQLGRPEYSYRFVVSEFRPLLDELGVVIEVKDPESEIDAIYASCRRHNVPCVFLSFMPPNKTPIGLACPTVCVFAWEYENLPNEAFGGKPRNDWRRVLARLGSAVTHSSFTVKSVHAVLGANFTIVSAPAPLWDRMQTVHGPHTTPATLPILRGVAIDSRRTQLADYRHSLLEAALPEALPLPANRHQHQTEIPLDGVLYTAVFNPYDGRKNCMLMIGAFCDALRDKPDATLLLKLTHHDPSKLIPDMLEIIYRAGDIACRVLLVHAYLEGADYHTLLRATTYAVNTSHGEGQCLPLMEYMSAGKPAIAPRHTSMLDYVDEHCAFVVDSSAEIGTWPHDQRQAFRTLRQRIHYQSLVMAYRRSYHVAREEPDVYASMSKAATESLRRYCSMETVRPRLQGLLAQVLDKHDLPAEDHG